MSSPLQPVAIPVAEGDRQRRRRHALRLDERQARPASLPEGHAVDPQVALLEVGALTLPVDRRCARHHHRRRKPGRLEGDGQACRPTPASAAREPWRAAAAWCRATISSTVSRRAAATATSAANRSPRRLGDPHQCSRPSRCGMVSASARGSSVMAACRSQPLQHTRRARATPDSRNRAPRRPAHVDPNARRPPAAGPAVRSRAARATSAIADPRRRSSAPARTTERAAVPVRVAAMRQPGVDAARRGRCQAPAEAATVLHRRAGSPSSRRRPALAAAAWRRRQRDADLQAVAAAARTAVNRVRTLEKQRSSGRSRPRRSRTTVAARRQVVHRSSSGGRSSSNPGRPPRRGDVVEQRGRRPGRRTGPATRMSRPVERRRQQRDLARASSSRRGRRRRADGAGPPRLTAGRGRGGRGAPRAGER